MWDHIWDRNLKVKYRTFNPTKKGQYLPVSPYKNTLVYRHREVVKDNDKQQLVCFYMVKKKPTWKGSAKVHSWSGSKQSKLIVRGA